MSDDDHMDAWLERDRRHKDAEARSQRLIELLMKERDALRAKLEEWEKVAPAVRAELEQTIKMYDEADLAMRKIATERNALRAKLDAIRRYVADRADSVDRPDCGSYPNAEARIWQEFFDGKEPQPKGETNGKA